MNDAKRNYLAFYFAIAVAISFIICFFTDPNGRDFGFWKRLLAFIVSTPAGFAGALIGDVMRRFAIPDAIFTTGGMFEIIKTKLFWMCVPQTVGLFIGAVIGAGIVLH